MNMIIYGRITNRIVKENEAHYRGVDHSGYNEMVLDVVGKEYVLRVNGSEARSRFDIVGPCRTFGNESVDVYLDTEMHVHFACSGTPPDEEFKLIVDCSWKHANPLCEALVVTGSSRFTPEVGFVPTENGPSKS